MKVTSVITVLLFLTCHEAVLSSVTRRRLQLLNGTDDVQSKIENMKVYIDADVEVNDVNFFVSYNGNDSNRNESLEYIFFLFHGWTQNVDTCPWYRPLTELLLKKYPTAQVVQVDFGKPAATLYSKAVFRAAGVGKIVTLMIQRMIKGGVPSEKIVLIGHSLGAQVTGWVGKYYRSWEGRYLPRIIALDPAGPIFFNESESRRLNKNDADVVFVIHTDIRRFGFPTNCGTIDFFPNGGVDQPGCPKMNMLSLPETLWCSHRRAPDIFIAALKNSSLFNARECDNYTNYETDKCDVNRKVSFGDLTTTEKGSYYLKITEDVPSINGTIEPNIHE